MPLYSLISYADVSAECPSWSQTELNNFLVKKYGDAFRKSHGMIIANINEQIPPGEIDTFIDKLLPALKTINDNYEMEIKPIVLMNPSIIDRNIHQHYSQDLKQTLGSAFNIIEIEPFRLYTYLQNNFNTDYSAQPTDCVSDSNKYLCKFGKFNKINSCLIFALLKESGLLKENRGLWSLAVDNTEKFNDHTNELFSIMLRYQPGHVRDIPRYDYSKYQKVLDRDFSNSFFHGEMHYTGFPFDTSHYANTRYSIVRETNWGASDNNFFISEKTWLPISMKHPFMLFGTTRVSKYLRDSGYVSPDDFQMSELSDLDNVTFSEAKQMFLENHNKFLTTPKAELQNMVEHNYDLFLKHVRDDMDKILSIPATYIDNMAPTQTLLDILLMMHYPNRIEDPNNQKWDYQKIIKTFS